MSLLMAVFLENAFLLHKFTVIFTKNSKDLYIFLKNVEIQFLAPCKKYSHSTSAIDGSTFKIF